MKKTFKLFFSSCILLLVVACNNETESSSTATTDTNNEPVAGQSAVQDDMSAKNVVQVAIGSKDIKAAPVKNYMP